MILRMRMIEPGSVRRQDQPAVVPQDPQRFAKIFPNVAHVLQNLE